MLIVVISVRITNTVFDVNIVADMQEINVLCYDTVQIIDLRCI